MRPKLDGSTAVPAILAATVDVKSGVPAQHLP
eukprot:CAMPEP_0202878414 /NCGR_PEP_ID=MMETSP1391-20130828/32152_1 /ASSEMBLY_ACC=CAM_ASM_000867 /TAXON_ID=1034604 /ORGANISM="Chlamydomonas leiostraca, Strain SAG 11-49" /LENGTH=31 /DNA_ID= /DNA_START= /DNA_END= /DNA_ORIENTATION=